MRKNVLLDDSAAPSIRSIDEIVGCATRRRTRLPSLTRAVAFERQAVDAPFIGSRFATPLAFGTYSSTVAQYNSPCSLPTMRLEDGTRVSHRRIAHHAPLVVSADDPVPPRCRLVGSLAIWRTLPSSVNGGRRPKPGIGVPAIRSGRRASSGESVQAAPTSGIRATGPDRRRRASWLSVSDGRACRQLLIARHDGIQHLVREPAGKGVLLAGVEEADERVRADSRLGLMPELRPRPGDRGPCASARCTPSQAKAPRAR